MALVSVVEAAKQLGVSRGTLYALARRKAIPHVKIGDRVLVDVEKVIAALEVGADSGQRPLVFRTKEPRKVAEK
jgi:excisionase family DNA binding protein